MYILIPAVLLIWGLVIWNIIKGLQSPDDNLQLATLPNYKTVEDSNQVNYALKLNYADPFLKGNYIKKTEPKEKTIDKQINRRFTEQIKKPEPKKRVIWPRVDYFGLIEGNKKVGLFQIEEKKIILRPGEINQNIAIENLYNDSAIIVLENEKKTIYK